MSTVYHMIIIYPGPIPSLLLYDILNQFDDYSNYIVILIFDIH